MEKLTYNEIMKNILSVTGNEISNIERLFLLFHAIFLKQKFFLKENKLIDSEWNSEYGRAIFEYSYKNEKFIFEIKKDQNTNNISVSVKSKANNIKSLNITSTIRDDDEKFQKINYDNLDETIKDLENYVKNTYIKEIENSFAPSSNNSNFNPLNYEQYNYFRSGGEVDPNNLLRSNLGQGMYNPMPNPFFSTGGGSVGGNLVGPTSDIFTGHMFPQPMSGIHPTFRYDPIGPFGTFGGPPNKDLQKKLDPYMGGNPFGGGFPPNNKKGPFGGNPFG